MHGKNQLQVKSDGLALAAMLCAVVILCIIGTCILSIGLHRRQLAVRTTSEISARCAADSGLTHAVYVMKKMLDEKTWNDSSLPYVLDQPLPNCDSTYSYTVSKIIAADENNDYYEIESIGKYGRSRKMVESAFELKGLFEHAIFVQNDILLKFGTVVVAYNLDADDPVLAIGTNSTVEGAITTKTGVTVDGDIIVGVDGDPDVVIDSKYEAAITGQTYAQQIEFEMPPVIVPQYLQDMPSGGDITGSIIISSSSKYDSINLTGSVISEIIEINGPVELYVVGDIRIGADDQLLIVDQATNPDASLTMYMGGNIIIDNSAAINNLSMLPKKLRLYGLDTCSIIDFKNSGTFYGAIYAPEADIHVRNSVQMYGAVVSKSFVQDVNADFYYDASLRIVDADDIGVNLVIKWWNE